MGFFFNTEKEKKSNGIFVSEKNSEFRYYFLIKKEVRMDEVVRRWLRIFVDFDKKLSTLKRRECPYQNFTVEYFFGQKVGELLFSSLGMRTVRDLVDVEALSLFETVFNFSEQTDREKFEESFLKVYDFFKSY